MSSSGGAAFSIWGYVRMEGKSEWAPKLFAGINTQNFWITLINFLRKFLSEIIFHFLQPVKTDIKVLFLTINNCQWVEKGYVKMFDSLEKTSSLINTLIIS